MKGGEGDVSLLEGVGMVIVLAIILFIDVSDGASKDNGDVVIDVSSEVFAVCS